MRPFLRFWREGTGASAVEFALVLPAFIALSVGTINLCIVLYANSTLHYTVDDAARCMSVRTTICTSTATTQTYALNHYSGPGVAPSFTATSTTCGGAGGAPGSKVTGTATYQLNTGLMNISVPLSATACFPS